MAESTQEIHPITRAIVLIVIAVSLATFIVRLVPEPRTIDDAYITFRYSRNIVEGNGFVYNIGQKTLGTTTPIYTLLMAGISWVTGSEQFPWFALVANGLADAVTAGLMALLIYRVTGHPGFAAIAGGIWAVNPPSVTFAVGGMETSVSIMWGVAALYAYFMRRDRWMAAFAALAILTRIDTLIWVGLLFAHQLFLSWRALRRDATGFSFESLRRYLPWQSWAIFGGLLLPWFGFSYVYFGTLISNSLRAKSVAYYANDLQAFTRFAQYVATPFAEHHLLGITGMWIGIFVYPILSMIGTFFAARRHPRLVPYLLHTWAYVMVFSAMNPVIFRWYTVPPLPSYTLAILIGLWAVVDAIASSRGAPRLRPVALTGIGMVFIISLSRGWELHPDHGPDRPAPKAAWHKIELNYRIMGEKLRDEYGVTEDTFVAAGDIGAVGYFSRARILDTVGLVTPEVLTQYYPYDRSLLVEDANYAVPPQLILDKQPDYVVLMEMMVRNGLAQTPDFNEAYEVVSFIPTDYYGEGMILYARR